MSDHGIGVAYGRVAPKVEKLPPPFVCIGCLTNRVEMPYLVCRVCAASGLAPNPAMGIASGELMDVPTHNHGIHLWRKPLDTDEAGPWQSAAIRAMEDRG